MKKIIYTLSVIAASVCALTSCQKEQDIQNELASNKKVTLSFIAEKAGIETRTAAVEGKTSVSYVWTDEDIANFKLFSVTNEEGKEVLSEIEELSIEFDRESGTQLTISAEVAPKTYTFRAILSGDWTDNGKGNKPRVKTTQVPNGTKNFDPTADILVSDDVNVEVGEEAEGGAMLLTFRRQIVVNKMTLKNLTPGEKVKKVTVKSDKHLTGYLNNGKMSGQQMELSLSYNNELVPEGGEFDVYFVTMPNTGQTLEVDVTTDQYNYSKKFAKTIDFNLGQFTKFGVALPEGKPVVDFVAGDYFITSAYNSTVYAAKAYNTGNNYLSNPLTINVNVDEESIVYQNDIEDCIFSIKAIGVEGHEGEFTIQDANGLYLYAAGGSSNNYLKGEENPDANAYWKIEKNANGTHSVISIGTAKSNILLFNSSNTSFNCYSSTSQTAITLYPAEWCKIDETPVVTIAEEERTKTVTSAATSVNFAYNANRYATEPLTVVVSSDVNSIIKGEPVVEKGVITVNLNPNTENIEKQALLTVAGEGLEDAPVTLTITQEAYAEWKTGNETFDLSKASYSSASEQSVTWTGSSTIITNEKGTGTKANNYLGGTNASSRFYTGNNLSIVPQNGYIITSVVFTATSANSTSYTSALANSNWTNATASVSGLTVTVTPTDGTSPITALVSGTCGFTSIVVNYLTLDSGEGGNTDPGTDPEQPGGGSYYVKITNTNELTSGHYLIVYEAGNVAFDGSLSTLDAKSNTIDVTIINGSKIASNSTTDAAVFTYDDGKGTFQSASGYFIGTTSDTNALLTSQTNPYTNEVSIDGDGNAMIKSSGGAYLRYNASDTRFRYYKSGTYTAQKAILLYKKVVAE